MIGIMNVPCESATEYYSAAPDSRNKASSSNLPTQLSLNSDKGPRPTIQKTLYSRRRSSQVDYLKDGRKLFNGKPIENASAPQMWEKLLLRSLVHKIEDEIASPAPVEKPVKQPLYTLMESDLRAPTRRPKRPITLEGRVVGRKPPRAQNASSIGSQKQFNELVRRSINPDQANTSTSTSTTHSPPPDDSTSYASLTNVSLNDCIDEDDCASRNELKYIIVENGKSEPASHLLQNTLPKSSEKSPVRLDTYKGRTVHYIINTIPTECPKSNDQMESNQLPPSAPPYGAPPTNQVHYAQIPAYEYAQQADGSQPHYQVEPVHVYHEQHAGTQSYYVTNYNSEYVLPDTRYVLEQPPANYYPPNGYVQPSTSNAYNGPHPPHVAYPHGAPPPTVVYSNAYDPRSQQRHYVDQKGYPIVNRGVVQIVDMSKPVTQTLPPSVPNDASKGKANKKRVAPVPTHTITAVPIDMESKNDNKKQFKCVDCGKCVSSSRNLTRHRESCKARKQKAAEDASSTVQPNSSSSSLGSPPKPSKSADVKQPVGAHPEQQAPPPQQSYQTYVPAESIPNVIYHGAPPPHNPYTPHYPAPHTALPHSNSQPIFEYPNTGIPSGLHSAPPTMGNYQPPLTPHYGPNSTQNPTPYDQRPIEYSGEYAYTAPMDTFIENTIDEMAHNPNPLAYIGGDYESSSSADRSLHENPDFANMHRNGPILTQQQTPKNVPPSHQLSTESAGPSSQQKTKNSGKNRKNNTPTPHQCSSCLKFMCSSRSLRRHKSTCKLYLKTTPELTEEEKQLIAKNEENKCKNCGKVLQSPSNLRRHENACKQRSEDESKPPLSGLQPNNSPSRNPTLVEHLTNQVATVVDPNSKRLMPPPEAQTSQQFQQRPGAQQPNVPPTTLIYVKSEDSMLYQTSTTNGSNVTVGEHLRHCYKPGSSISPASKQPARRPLILGRKTSLQNPELHLKIEDPLDEPPATCPPTGQNLSPPPSAEFHSRSAPPIDISPKDIKQECKFESEEAIRKSEQVVDVINSVVEKIRRQTVAEQQQIDGPNELDGPTPMKIARMDEKMPGRPMSSIITTQPLPASTPNQMLQPPHFNNQIVAQPVMIQQRPISQIQVPLVAAEQESNNEVKIVARYFCPECLKFYACRKNVRAHRINTHNLTEEQADANASKRVKVSADTGFILTPGFDRENAMLEQRSVNESIKPTVVKTAGQPRKRNSTASNGENRLKKSPNKPPPLQTPNGQHHPNDPMPSQIQSAPPHYYMPNNGMHPVINISPQYEQLRPIPMDSFGPPQQQMYATAMPQPPHNYNPNFMPNDDLEIWDQIKSRVDVPYLSTQNDEINVASIAADLKRSVESEITQQPVSNGTDFHPTSSSDSKTNVEKMEADSTICDEVGSNAAKSVSNESQQSTEKPLLDDAEDNKEDVKKTEESFTTQLPPTAETAVKVDVQSS